MKINKLEFAIAVTFCALVATFVILAAMITLKFFGQNLIFFAFVFFLLGAALLVLTIRAKMDRLLKIFLLLTSGSSVAFFVSLLLHNLVYGFFICIYGPDFWGVTGGDEPVFFIIAVFVCPAIFMIGGVGTAAVFIKKKLRG